MAWTRNRSRSRESDRRHCPGLEALDERCLLSTGAGTAALIMPVPIVLLPFMPGPHRRPRLDHDMAPAPSSTVQRVSTRATGSAVCQARATRRHDRDRGPDRLRPDRRRRGGPIRPTA